MSEQNTGTPPATPPSDDQDPIKQVKSEFSRKHKEQSDMLTQLMNSQVQIQDALAKLSAPPKPQRSAAEDDKELEDLMYSNPKAYSARLKEEAKREALAEMRAESSTQSSVNQAIAALAAEYPELSDQDSELTKASVAILKNATDAEKISPKTYEYAVMKAAAALEVKPKSKRKDPDDDFVAPSYTSPQARSKKRSTDQIVNQNKDMAKEFGLNLDDPKTKERYLSILKNKGVI